jgi:hypothetical protein
MHRLHEMGGKVGVPASQQQPSREHHPTLLACLPRLPLVWPPLLAERLDGCQTERRGWLDGAVVVDPREAKRACYRRQAYAQSSRLGTNHRIEYCHHRATASVGRRE